MAKLSTQDENFGQNVHGQTVLAKLSYIRPLETYSDYIYLSTTYSYILVSYSYILVAKGTNYWKIRESMKKLSLSTLPTCRYGLELWGIASLSVVHV